RPSRHRAPDPTAPLQAADPILRGESPRLGLALEVRDLVCLAVSVFLGACEVFLGLTLALLLDALTTRARVAEQIARGLLDASSQLVSDAHVRFYLRVGVRHRRVCRVRPSRN